jgi:hypothetical protein
MVKDVFASTVGYYWLDLPGMDPFNRLLKVRQISGISDGHVMAGKQEF